MTKRALDPDEIDWDDVSHVLSEGSNLIASPDYLRMLYADGHMTLDGMQLPKKVKPKVSTIDIPDERDA